jgi:hypothetical protein
VGGNTLTCEEVGGGGAIPTKAQKLWYSVYYNPSTISTFQWKVEGERMAGYSYLDTMEVTGTCHALCPPVLLLWPPAVCPQTLPLLSA